MPISQAQINAMFVLGVAVSFVYALAAGLSFGSFCFIVAAQGFAAGIAGFIVQWLDRKEYRHDRFTEED